MLIADILDHYISSHLPELADQRRQRIALDHLREHFGALPAAEVRSEHVASYCVRRRSGVIGRRASDPTLRRELNVLIAASNRAAFDGKIGADAIPRIRLPKSAPPKDRVLSHAEVAALFAKAEGPLLFFVRIAYYTASRRRAVETLKWEQVDLAARRIHFEKGAKVGSCKRRVPVPISDALWPTIVLAHGIAEKTGGQFVLGAPRDLLKQFKRLCASCGIDGATPHTLRHSRAVHLAQAGVSLYAIAGLLGDSMKTVERNYLHHCPDHLSEVLNVDATSAPPPQCAAAPPLG